LSSQVCRRRGYTQLFAGESAVSKTFVATCSKRLRRSRCLPSRDDARDSTGICERHDTDEEGMTTNRDDDTHVSGLATRSYQVPKLSQSISRFLTPVFYVILRELEKRVATGGMAAHGQSNTAAHYLIGGKPHES